MGAKVFTNSQAKFCNYLAVPFWICMKNYKNLDMYEELQVWTLADT